MKEDFFSDAMAKRVLNWILSVGAAWSSTSYFVTQKFKAGADKEVNIPMLLCINGIKSWFVKFSLEFICADQVCILNIYIYSQISLNPLCEPEFNIIIASASTIAALAGPVHDS